LAFELVSFERGGSSSRRRLTGIAKPDRSAVEDPEQLRRENAKLKMEIEILKKAAIYFAREAK
jgi:transposase-like protein